MGVRKVKKLSNEIMMEAELTDRAFSRVERTLNNLKELFKSKKGSEQLFIIKFFTQAAHLLIEYSIIHDVDFKNMKNIVNRYIDLGIERVAIEKKLFMEMQNKIIKLEAKHFKEFIESIEKKAKPKTKK